MAAQSFEVSTEYIRGLLGAVSSIRTSGKAKQVCTVSVSSAGVGFMTEDESKCIQGEVFLRPQVFKKFTVEGGMPAISLELGNLVDVVSVMASSSPGAELELSWPDRDGRLVLQLRETTAEGTEVCTFGELACVTADPPERWDAQWEEPTSSFVVEGAVLKEAVDDLDWTGGGVSVTFANKPLPTVTLAGRGNAGALTVELPLSVLGGSLKVPDDSDESYGGYSYKHKHLKSAMSHIPTNPSSNVRSKVSCDANGMLHVHHLLSTAGAHPGHGTQQGGVLYGQEALSAVSQGTGGGGGGGGGRTATVTFYIVPLEDDDDE